MNGNNPTTAEEFVAAILAMAERYRPTNMANGDVPTSADHSPLRDARTPSDSDKPKPWESNTATAGINLLPDALLYGKMQWVRQNIPGGMSLREMLKVATEKYVNEMIEKHYKG